MTTVQESPLAAPSDADVEAVLDDLDVSPHSNVIGVLQDVQDRLGYLPPNALQGISARTKTRLSRIYGVVTFYSQFYTEPHGRHTIRCCQGTACHVKGGRRVLDAVKRILVVDEGETTPDLMFYLETVACLGTCFLAPVMMIDDQYFGQVTPKRVGDILRTYREE